MKIVSRFLTILCTLALAAHFLRWNQPLLTLACLCFPLLLISAKPWALWTVRVFLLAGAAVWLQTGISIVLMRLPRGEPFARAMIIMAGVALLTAGTAFLLRMPPGRSKKAVEQG